METLLPNELIDRLLVQVDLEVIVKLLLSSRHVQALIRNIWQRRSRPVRGQPARLNDLEWTVLTSPQCWRLFRAGWIMKLLFDGRVTQTAHTKIRRCLQQVTWAWTSPEEPPIFLMEPFLRACLRDPDVKATAISYLYQQLPSVPEPDSIDEPLILSRDRRDRRDQRDEQRYTSRSQVLGRILADLAQDLTIDRRRLYEIYHFHQNEDFYSRDQLMILIRLDEVELVKRGLYWHTERSLILIDRDVKAMLELAHQVSHEMEAVVRAYLT